MALSYGPSRMPSSSFEPRPMLTPCSQPPPRVKSDPTHPAPSGCVAAAMADVLDSLSASIFLVESDGRVVYANEAGQAMLAAGDMPYIASGSMAAPAAERDRAFRGAFATA